MSGKKPGIRVMDLFCGAGGFSEGFRQAGFDVVFGIDHWKPACDTHELNGLGETGQYDLLNYGPEDMLVLHKKLRRKVGTIDVVIGSPPCTEFSFAKNGGKGDIDKGMLLVNAHLRFISIFKPRYWLMENVPRFEHLMSKEYEKAGSSGWKVPYEILGMKKSLLRDLGIESDCLEIPMGGVLKASEYGTCQGRKRFFAGLYPLNRLESYKCAENLDTSLGGLVRRLEENVRRGSRSGRIEDPNYRSHFIDASMLRDYGYPTEIHPMHWEEMRYLKRRHIQYGRMDFPDDLNEPARTIMATSTQSSREAIVLDTGKTTEYQGRNRPVYRQPTVREVACIQGFPLGFQLKAGSIQGRYRLIGNAVPCQLSHAIACAIRDDAKEKIGQMGDSGFAARVNTTVARAKKAGGPIIVTPKKAVPEVARKDDDSPSFKAKPNKRMRRRLMSSKLESYSEMIVFDNSSRKKNGITGGNEWKAFLHSGIGSEYHSVRLDEQSTKSIIGALKRWEKSGEARRVVARALRECDAGIPVLPANWHEFKDHESGVSIVDGSQNCKRQKIPGVDWFQRAFTQDTRGTGEFCGPLDFFDGVDLIMSRTFSPLRYRKLSDGCVHVNRMSAGPGHRHVLTKAKKTINDTDIPLVTLVAGLLSIHLLEKMYEASVAPVDSPFRQSLSRADKAVARWTKK
ncbi:MAG: DNA cytosine methyltransferase [Thermoplasmata archaeon]